ncbi:hypothetical protein O1611_g9394 [Lasiodiplodia mahajangana]|uniref:Uncharacterized protein n=1 Tax=Lasiodiplodia mahajangana TaxID=1108764 RepID=A0ACC2JA48_9PEZI|nr:hypothetical protein O1611_g9394 [Lasiodiplodia mahajangana]
MSISPALAEPTGTMSADDMAASILESQSDSYEERAARLQDILDFDLPKLRRWCEKTYEILSSLTSVEPAGEERKRLNLARRSFNLARRPLAEDDAAYIDISSSDLPFRDDPDTHATMRKIECSTNLVSLLLSLIDVKRSKQAILPFLQQLDNAFHTMLYQAPSDQLEDCELALRLRCYYFMESLQVAPEAEPHILATTIFCKQAASTPDEAMLRLLEGPFRGLGHLEHGKDYTTSEYFKEQMESIIAKISLPERNKIFEAFSGTLPERDDLLEELRAWALRMYLHVNQKADENGLPSNDQNPGQVNHGVVREGSKGLHPSEDGRSDAGSDSGSSSEHEYHKLKTITKEPSFIQDPATLAAVRQSERERSRHPRTEPPLNQQPAKGKMTGSQIVDAILRLNPADVLEPTPDAEDPTGTRAPYSRSHSGSQSSSTSQELGAAGKRRRPRRPQEDEDYVDDNDDFEVNEQLIDESRRIQHGDSNTAKPVTKRSRFSGNSGNMAGRSLSPDDDTPASTNVRERDLAVLSQVAHANRLANKPRGHQIRERWSDVDTDHLINLIADRSLGCSWAAMEKEGGFQTKRNQQAIRDKARNLKKGYLCADAILPSGFDYVYLSKKERDDVIASGHNPDRREDDIDERGRVTHNLWRDRSE